MTNPMQAIQEDLAFAKALASEGRNSPLTGGPILLMAGTVWGTAALAIYACSTDLIAVGRSAPDWIWGAATLVFFVGLIVLVRGIKRVPGATSLNNRANAAGWMGAGWGIFAFALATGAAGWRLHDANLLWLFAPAILTFYGTCWTVAAAMTNIRWLHWLIGGSFAGAVLMAFMAGANAMFLAYAAALYLLVALPGYLLMRGQPTAMA